MKMSSNLTDRKLIHQDYRQKEKHSKFWMTTQTKFHIQWPIDLHKKQSKWVPDNNV